MRPHVKVAADADVFLLAFLCGPCFRAEFRAGVDVCSVQQVMKIGMPLIARVISGAVVFSSL
jgi:hypothetical protein